MKDVDAQELNDNEILLDSMLFRMIRISENVKKLSTEYRESENELPWNELIGLRNRIVHDYGNVDLNIVFETLKYDIPDLLERLSNSKGNSNDFSNGFTPRLDLLKVNYPMNDESTLHNAGCFFFGLIDKSFGLRYNFFGFGGQNYGLQTNKKTGK